MPIKQKLSSSINADGIFWYPNDENATFSAKLTKVGGFISLTTTPVFEELDRNRVSELFAQMNDLGETGNPQVLLGMIEGSPCTLFGLQRLNDGGFQDLAKMQAVTYQQYRVSLCVMGLHIETPDLDSVEFARITYSGLKYWHRAKMIVNRTDHAMTLVFPRNEPPLVQVSCVLDKVQYEFGIEPRINLMNGEVKTTNEAIIRILPSAPKSLSWYFERAYRIQGYFCLIIGSSLQMRSVALKVGDSVGWCRRRNKGLTEEVRREITVKLSPSDIGRSMAAWLALPESFSQLEQLLFAIWEEKVSTDTAFLSIAKALEGFERLTYVWPTNKKVTFRMRLDELLERITPEFAKRLLGDTTSFEFKLITTRDHLTHPGLPLKPEVIIDSHDLFLFTVRCKVFLRFLILRFIGLSEEVLTDPMFQHSRLWS